MEILSLTDRNEDAVLDRTTSLIKRGGVVAVPTDTVYGLIADALRDPAVRKVFRIKARAHAKAMPVFVASVAEARKYAYIDAKLEGVLRELWPGQTTVVLKKKDAMPDVVTGGEATVGLRIPDYPFLKKLLERVGRPLVGTSANISGNEPAQNATEVQETFKNKAATPDLLIDAGPIPPSPPSTVLDLTRPHNPRIMRVGAITKEKLDEFFSHWKKPNQ